MPETRKRRKSKPSAARGRRRSQAAGVGHAPGELADLALAELHFDERNPRLPEEAQKGDQDELLRYMVAQYEPVEVGRSIAAHGYFRSEPLIVVYIDGRYVVVEGNRRLAALQLLADPGKAHELELDGAEEWTELAQMANIPQQIPVVIAPSRMAVAPIIGYRHISGIEPWDAFAKARFLSNLVDKEKNSFEEAAALVGEKRGTVRAHYRNYRIAKQARDSFKLDISRAQKRFGVFTRAMQDPRILEYIGAPESENVKPRKRPLPAKAKPKLQEVLSWIYGDKKNAAIFTDSRQISALGTVLGSKDGTEKLQETRNLDEAFAAAGGIRQRLLHNLTEAARLLAVASSDFEEYSDDEEVLAALDACEHGASVLRDLVE